MGARVQAVRLQCQDDQALQRHVPHEVHHVAAQAEPARQKRKLKYHCGKRSAKDALQLSQPFPCLQIQLFVLVLILFLVLILIPVLVLYILPSTFPLPGTRPSTCYSSPLSGTRPLSDTRLYLVLVLYQVIVPSTWYSSFSFFIFSRYCSLHFRKK